MTATGRDPLGAARQAVEREPGNPIAWVLLAEEALDAGDAGTGESAALRALSLAPGHPEALARLGRAQWLQRRFGDAARSLRAAAGLFDMRGFATDFAAAVHWMAQRHRQGLPPESHDFG